MRDNKELTKYVASFLLGDASICKDSRYNSNCTFEICQIEDHLDYLEWIKNIIGDITTTTLLEKPMKSKEIIFPNGITSMVKQQYRVRSKSHPFFNKFREKLYATGRKTIDFHYFTLFDWETLAIWYMDDGYISDYVVQNKQGYRYKYPKLGLSTQGFTQAENFVLKKFIKEKFDLEFNLLRNKYPSGIKYRLVAKTSDIPKFLDGITPYILPSFEYKLEYKHEKLSEDVSPEKGEEIV